MVFEIAQLDIKTGLESEFENGVAAAGVLFSRAKGCRGVELQRSVEHPNRYWLIVKWEKVEDHTINFRNSEDFQEWRRLVSHCFAGPAAVEHTAEIWKGF